jgi:hypothetical protein
LWALTSEGAIQRRIVREVQTLVAKKNNTSTTHDWQSAGMREDVTWNSVLSLNAHRLESSLKFIHFTATCVGSRVCFCFGD